MSHYDDIIQRIVNADLEHLLPLIRAALDTPLFGLWPASVGVDGKPWHHGDEGGLLRHTWQVLDLSLHMAAAHNIHPGPLAVGAVWHDIGKLECYVRAPSGEFVKSITHQSHHISVGLTWWGQRGPELISRCLLSPGDEDMYRRVRHMIESHHGRREWGSPSPPGTLEAMLLHHADMQSVMMDNLAAKSQHSDSSEH